MHPLTVFRIDPETMLFMYPEPLHPYPDGSFMIPGNCVQLAPPDVDGVDRPRWESSVPVQHAEFGKIDQGAWIVVQDYRKTALYQTSDGTEYTLGQDVDGQVFCGIGELPSWLTLDARPSVHHQYVDGTWKLDEAAELADVKSQRINLLSQNCHEQIFSGFESDALGASHHYPASDTDQRNLTASVLDSTVPGTPADWMTPFWCADAAGVWDFRMHTAEQIQSVGQDGKKRILACMGHNQDLVEQVRAATDKATVLAIVWTDPATA